jgi:hypothetical protein
MGRKPNPIPNGRAGDFPPVMVSGPRWPGLRALWLWLRQGCPRRFPVVTRRGEIVGRVSQYLADGTAVIDASGVTVRGWTFDFSLCETGVYRVADLSRDLQERYPVRVVHPDGREELTRCRHADD